MGPIFPLRLVCVGNDARIAGHGNEFGDGYWLRRAVVIPRRRLCLPWVGGNARQLRAGLGHISGVRIEVALHILLTFRNAPLVPCEGDGKGRVVEAK